MLATSARSRILALPRLRAGRFLATAKAKSAVTLETELRELPLRIGEARWATLTALRVRTVHDILALSPEELVARSAKQATSGINLVKVKRGSLQLLTNMCAAARRC